MRCDLGKPDLTMAREPAASTASVPVGATAGAGGDAHGGAAATAPATRRAHFPGSGAVDATVHRLADLTPGERVPGPAFVESPVTTVVVEPGGSVELAPTGSLLLRPAEASA